MVLNYALFIRNHYHPPRPPVSKSGSDVLPILQCSGTYHTPAQRDILVSDKALFLAQLCITIFYSCRDQSHIRIKSEVGTDKPVEALQCMFFFC